MASRPAEELVQGIARAYEAALAALAAPHGATLPVVQGHLDQVDQLTLELREQEPLGAVDPLSIRRVQELHSQLCAILEGTKMRMSSQLRRTGEGRRALKGYRSRSTAVGRYHRSEG